MKYVSPKKAEACAQEIISWAKSHYLWEDCGIYVNGKCYCSYKADPGMELMLEETNDIGEKIRVWVGERDVSRYFEYYNKDHFLSMFFEGPIYDILNFYGPSMNYCQKMEQEFGDILAKYGYWYELGNQWNLSLYKAD